MRQGKAVRTGPDSGSERGQVLIMFVLMLAVLMGMVGLAIDVGLILHERRQAQTAADAAALAAVRELPGLPSQANSVVLQYAEENGFDPDDSDVTVESTTPYQGNLGSIEVRINREVGFLFGRVLGLTGIDVHARAVANVGSLTGTLGLMPFGVLEDAVSYCPYEMLTLLPVPAACETLLKYNVDDVGSNIGDLDFDGKGGGANEIAQMIRGKNTDPLCSINEPSQAGCSTTEPSKPGNSTGQIRQGMDWRLNNTTIQCDTIAEVVGPDTDGDGRAEVRPGCNPWGPAVGADSDGDGGTCDEINWNDGRRGSCNVIAIPVIQPPLPQSSSDATNVGFALFWIKSLEQCSGNDCEISGYFINAEASVSGLATTLNAANTPFVVYRLVE